MSYVRPEIAAMAGYVPGEQPQAGKFIKLNTNENPYPPSSKVVRAIQEAAETSLIRYPDPLGTPFRIRAAELWGVEPDWILCGNGSDDILTILTRAMVAERKLLRLPYPSYVLYKTLAEIQGARSQEVKFQADWTLADDFVAPDPDLGITYLPNPNSPSGTILSPDQVLELASKLEGPLLVDEAYADFADEHCVSLVKQNERIMVSRTLSKGYGLAGLRFGYLIAQPHLIAELQKVKDSYNCDALSIAAATAAIDDQIWLQDNVDRVRQTRERMFEELMQMGFSVQPSQANFLWCTHPDWSLKTLFEEMKAKRILIRYMLYPEWGEGLRITVGTDEQVDACLAVMRSLL
ncbi:MAG: histidinol-phosphate transaminase [Planctomycetaceae bacterium]|nr:histidinol-phosphate transaminase [Planctomycetaceae bacterium]